MGDLVLLGYEVPELEVILDHFVPPVLDKVQKWAPLTLNFVTIADGFLQKVSAVLGGAKAALQETPLRVSSWCHFEPVKAADREGHIDCLLVPDIESTLTLLLIAILRLIVDQNPLDHPILPKELLAGKQGLGVAVLSWKSNNIKQLRYDNPEVLYLFEVIARPQLDIEGLCIRVKIERFVSFEEERVALSGLVAGAAYLRVTLAHDLLRVVGYFRYEVVYLFEGGSVLLQEVELTGRKTDTATANLQPRTK